MGTVLLSGCWDTHLSGQTKAKALVEKRFQGQLAHRSCYAHLRAQNCCCCSHENLWLGCRYYVDNGGFCKWNAYKMHVHGIRGIPMYTNVCRIPYTPFSAKPGTESAERHRKTRTMRLPSWTTTPPPSWLISPLCWVPWPEPAPSRGKPKVS